jgi:putative PIG3 family NAD(P)H quinone oxidoreductase
MPDAHCVRIDGAGDVDVLKLAELQIRDPGPGEVLVKVGAAGLNRADILQRQGFYPPPPGVAPDIPGLEFAGAVVAVGDGVTSWKKDDRVMGIVPGGAMATHVLTHERLVAPVPEGMTMADAAAVPEVFMTAYDALFRQADLRMGQLVLIHSVGSGVGTAAVQLSKFAGARTIGTSRTPAKLDRCRPLGMDEGIVVKDGRFLQALLALPGKSLPNVILDTVGAAYLKENIQALSDEGRLVVIGLMGGVQAELSLGLLLRRRAKVMGSVIRSRPLEQRAALTQAFIRDVLPLLQTGHVRPVVDETFPMSKIREAHRKLESDQTFGKIVLSWG